MKALKNVFSVLTVLFAVIALVLFFFPFGKVIIPGQDDVVRTGTEFAFGASYNSQEIGKSSDLLLCLITTALSVLFAGLSFKFKKTRWATCGFTLFTTIYMLVVTLSASNKFIDTQGFEVIFAGKANSTAYVNNAPLFITIALALSCVAAVAYLLIADKIDCLKNNKPTIIKRLVKFLRDYKGELKKIVWPGPKTVLKNTLIVLIMCALVGAFILALDFGLGKLLQLILGL